MQAPEPLTWGGFITTFVGTVVEGIETLHKTTSLSRVVVTEPSDQLYAPSPTPIRHLTVSPQH